MVLVIKKKMHLSSSLFKPNHIHVGLTTHITGEHFQPRHRKKIWEDVLYIHISTTFKIVSKF